MTIAAPVVVSPKAVPDRPKARRLHALTSLRFFAAALIVVHHTRAESAFNYSIGVFSRIPLDQAVSFFFVLSGFILTYVYPELPTWKSRGRFMLARFGRIWPAHVMALVLVYLLLHNPTRMGTPKDTLLLGGVYLAMLQSWIPIATAFFAYNSVAWSISTEFGFYYLFPMLIHNFRKTWHVKLFAAAMLAFAMITLANRLHLPGYSMATMNTVTSTGLVYINPLARVFEFVLGMCVALLWRNVHGKLDLDAVAEPVARLWRSTLGRVRLPVIGKWIGALWRMTLGRLSLAMALGTSVELAALGVLFGNLWYATRLAGHAQAFSLVGAAGSEWLVHGPVSCLSFGLLIFVMASELGLIAKALSAPIGVVLGEISFTVYLIHQILVRFYVWKKPLLNQGPVWLQLVVYWIVLLVMAHLIWALFERPMRSFIVGLGRRGEKKKVTGPEPMRGMFAWALNPSRDALVGEGLLLAALLVPVVSMFVLAPANGSAAVPTQQVATDAPVTVTDTTAAPSDDVSMASGATAGSQTALAPADAKDIHFADVFTLKSIQLTRDGRDMKMRIEWQCQSSFDHAYRVGVHLLDGAGAKVDQDDYDLSRTSGKAGDTWVELHTVPAGKMAGVKVLGLGVYDWQLLKVDRGPRDMQDHRLLIQVPQP